jgi:hypothetical protein
MTTIKLHIPDDLADKVQRITGNVETFIIDLIRSKLTESDKRLSLADQYRMAAAENVVLMKDFAHIDLEGWDDEY